MLTWEVAVESLRPGLTVVAGRPGAGKTTLAHELARAGASVSEVVQTRVYVTDISRSEEVGRAHGEVFGEVRPLMTMVEVSALIDPRMLVEIEVMAVAPGRSR